MTSLIEKGIPIPKRTRGKMTKDFAAMEQGDSLFFAFPDDCESRNKFALSVYARAYSWARRHKMERRWTVNIEEKEGTWGVRLWRSA